MNADTILLRQAHPSFVTEGQLSSQAFVPFPKDEGKLSVYDGDKISAADAYHHYTELLRFQSAGVWGVTCAEAQAQDLACLPDPQDGFPEHAVIDFSGHPTKAIRRLAKLLRDCATARGCLHSP